MPDQTGTHTTPPAGGENNQPSEPVHTATTATIAAAAKRDLARQEQILLPEESVQDFRRLRLGMHEDLRPQGVLESTLVERYIVNQWRMQRCAIMEAELIAHRREYATAWANPRRVKTAPTAGAVWGDDQQFYGGALEKLAKYEYRLSLECSRVLRQLAQRQKARESEPEVGTAWEPQISQMDADTSPHPRRSATPPPPRGRGPGGEVAERHAAEPTPESGNLQNELPSPVRNATAATKEAQPRQGKPQRAPYDTDQLRAEIERRVNRHLNAQAGALGPLRQGVDPRLKATWVGSGA